MSARLLAILESIPGEAYLALIELCATGFIAFVAVESYQCYRQYADVLSVLQETPSLDVGNDLVQAMRQRASGSLPYAAVRGKVVPAIGVIPPSRNGVPSVIRITDQKEIRSKYAWNGSRYTYVGKSFETQEFHPFYLGPVSDCSISISFETTKAYLADSLAGATSSITGTFGSIFSSSKPYQSPALGTETEVNFPVLLIKDITVPDTSGLLLTFPTFFEKSEDCCGPSGMDSKFLDFIDYILGLTAVNGVQKTEKLLPTNEIITVLGRVVKVDENQYTLTASSVPNSLYMLTTESFDDIVQSYSIKTAVAHFCVIALACGGLFFLYDAIKRLKSLYDQCYPHQFDDNPLHRRFDCDTADANAVPDEQTCVVCQERPRNMLLLNCRHLCVCDVCSHRLDGRCPLCRQQISRRMFIYV